jgi:arginyl-tRNA synthetase
MSENHIFQRYQNHVAAAVASLQQAGRLPGGLDLTKVTVEPPRDASHGELSSNIGLVLTKQAGMPPRALAELMAETMSADPALGIERWSVDGPGFLNLTLAQHVWAGELGLVLKAGRSFGDSAIGQGRIINVEYVSANPTGPMHVGHCRGAIVGEVLKKPGSRLRANITSTMPVRRSTSSRARSICATARRWGRRSVRSPTGCIQASTWQKRQQISSRNRAING